MICPDLVLCQIISYNIAPNHSISYAIPPYHTITLHVMAHHRIDPRAESPAVAGSPRSKTATLWTPLCCLMHWRRPRVASVTQSLSRSVAQSLSRSVAQSLSRSVAQSVSQSVSQSPQGVALSMSPKRQSAVIAASFLSYFPSTPKASSV